jgi:hypothetical protein
MNQLQSILILLVLVLSILGCTEELSIADFADDFKNYEVELRIEGLLDQQDFSNSVIRIDRTILVTDTSLFNGVDDNGDWESFTDLNGNGVWDEGEPLNDDIGGNSQGPNEPPLGQGNGIPDPGEPHVDDYIEILPQVHDSTMVSVVLRDAENSSIVAEFIWKSNAVTFDVNFGPGGPPELVAQNPYVRYTYGAYVPDTPYRNIQLDSSKIYTVEITTDDDRVISASTNIVTPPKNIEWDNTLWNDDTLINPINNFAYLTWNNPIESVFSTLALDLIFKADSMKEFYSYARAAFQLDPETNLPLFRESFVGFPLGMYYLKLSTLNNTYGRYLYSGLPLSDRSLSNWRDQNGSVVLGVLGSTASTSFYIRLASVSG